MTKGAAMRALALIPLMCLATACVADPMGPGGSPPPLAQNGNDCAVIAAVAREKEGDIWQRHKVARGLLERKGDAYVWKGRSR